MTTSTYSVDDTKHAQITGEIVGFLRTIGLTVQEGTLETPTFLPGILIEQGTIIYDPSKLAYPGDLLHEAGHLAVLTPAVRKEVRGDVGGQPHEEMMAIAWSYAASVHLGLAPEIVFHDAGYRGGSQSLIENFTQGYYIGVPTLQWLGLTVERKHDSQQPGITYPQMCKWLVD